MSGFSPIDRAVLSWVTILCVSRPMTDASLRAMRELRGLAEDIDRLELGAMQSVNAAVAELVRCSADGMPQARCLDYCRLALLDFHLARQPAERGA